MHLPDARRIEFLDNVEPGEHAQVHCAVVAEKGVYHRILALDR